MIYNNINFSDYFKVLKRERSFTPPTDISTAGVRGKDGVWFLGSSLDVSYISVRIELIGSEEEPLMKQVEAINALLFTREPKELTLLDNPDRFYRAKYESASIIDRYGMFAVANLTFMILYPFAISKNEIKINNLNTQEVINRGVNSVWGNISITMGGAAESLRVEINPGEEYIRIVDTFLAGDLILIDLENETVTKNGRSIIEKVDFRSDFFSIPVGSSNITTDDNPATLTFREEWL